MAFPASNVSLANAWIEMQRLALTIQRQANAAIVDLQQPVTAAYVLAIYQGLVNAQLSFTDLASAPGLAQYVKDQLGDQAVDIVVEYQAMMAAIENAKTFIINNFPKDGNGFLLEKQFSSQGFASRTFNAVQMADLRTALQGVVDSII